MVAAENARRTAEWQRPRDRLVDDGEGEWERKEISGPDELALDVIFFFLTCRGWPIG